jgi:hypothetical protein
VNGHYRQPAPAEFEARMRQLQALYQESAGSCSLYGKAGDVASGLDLSELPSPNQSPTATASSPAKAALIASMTSGSPSSLPQHRKSRSQRTGLKTVPTSLLLTADDYIE